LNKNKPPVSTGGSGRADLNKAQAGQLFETQTNHAPLIKRVIRSKKEY
jgi:hypothetical protein